MIWKNGTQGTKVITINERKLTSREWKDAFPVFRQILSLQQVCVQRLFTVFGHIKMSMISEVTFSSVQCSTIENTPQLWSKSMITRPSLRQFEGNISNLANECAGMSDRLNFYDLIDVTHFIAAVTYSSVTCN